MKMAKRIERHVTYSCATAYKGEILWDIRRCYDAKEQREITCRKFGLKTWRQAYNRRFRIVRIKRTEEPG